MQEVLENFMLRRLKSDVLKDLVPKKEILVYCPLTTLQKTLYKAMLQTVADSIDKSEVNIYTSIYNLH